MAQVKLNLRSKSDLQLIQFCEGHRDAMVGNANFPTPSPTATIYDAALADFDGKVEAAKAAELAAKEAVAQKDASRAVLEGLTTDRGNYVDGVAKGSEPIILSADLPVRDVPSPVGPLPAPVDFLPTMGDEPGEIDLQWSPVKGKSSYVLEWRAQGTTGAWSQRLGTKSKQSVQGLTSGTTYVFRVAAVGAAGQGPWSLEAARMAP